MRLVPNHTSTWTSDGGVQIPDAHADKHGLRSKDYERLVDRIELMYGDSAGIEYRPPLWLRLLQQ